MSIVPDEGMRHVKSRAYYGAGVKSYPGTFVRHERSCADYGPALFDDSPDSRKMYGDTPYLRKTYMNAHYEFSEIEKSSEPSWVAAQGTYCICLVTWNKDVVGGNSIKPELNKIFDNPFEEPEAAVSLQLGINEMNVGNGQLGINEINVGNGRAASFVERNKIVVTSFLRKLLKAKSDFSYDETIKLAVYLFDQMFPGFVKADKIKVFVLKNDEKNIMTIEDETLLKGSQELYNLYGEMRPMKHSRLE